MTTGRREKPICSLRKTTKPSCRRDAPTFYRKTVALSNHVVIVDRLNTYPRPYKLAFLDCCHSAGGAGGSSCNAATGVCTGTDKIGSPDSTWSRAFGVYPGRPYGFFMGWNGTATAVGGINGRNRWYYWEEKLWRTLVDQRYTFSDMLTAAFNYANIAANGNNTPNYPWDTLSSPPYSPRLQYYGDINSRLW